MNKLLLISFLILISFSGCTVLDKLGVKSTNEDNSGNGLVISFSTDTKRLGNAELQYTITFSNTGKEKVLINRENLKLRTIEKDSSGEDIFTTDSIEDFYSRIFRDGEFELYQNQQREFEGTLKIKEEFYDNPNKEEINFFIEYIYDYQTDFDNNLEINIDKTELKHDQISQAAPIQITAIAIGYTGDFYTIDYTIANKGPTDLSKFKRIDFEQVELNFRSNQFSDCKAYYKKGDYNYPLNINELHLSEDYETIEVSCKADMSGFDSFEWFTTKTFGTITYKYPLFIEGSIKLPEIRNDNIWNN